MPKKTKKQNESVQEQVNPTASPVAPPDITPLVSNAKPSVLMSVNVVFVPTKDGTEPKTLASEYEGQSFTEVVGRISRDVRTHLATIGRQGGYLVSVIPTKFVIGGFTKASGNYQHTRAMEAIAAIIYNMAAFENK